MIYFVQSVDGGPIKIGYTGNLAIRLYSLKTHYETPFAVLATMQGGRAEESELHGRFAHLRLGRTEQFQPAPDLMAFIGLPLLASANPDAVEAMPCQNASVKMDAEVADECRIAAAMKGMSLAEYISETLRVAAKHDIDEEYARRGTRPKSPKGPKS